MITADKGEVKISSKYPLGTKEARAGFTAELVTIYLSLADEYGLEEALYMMQLAATAFASDYGINIKGE